MEQQLFSDMKAALKEGRKFELNTLRSVLAQIKDERISLRPKRELNDEDVMKVLLSAVKKRKEAVELYYKGNRPELAEKEEKEIAVLQKYLPKQLSSDEIREIIDSFIIDSGADSIKDMGKVMGAAMGRLKGKADGKIVQEIVRERLGRLSQ